MTDNRIFLKKPPTFIFRMWLGLFYVLLSHLEMEGQTNYVRNPSFEQYSQCPNSWDQIRFANYWNSIDSVDTTNSCLPDYCNICAGNNGFAGVPVNNSFYHYPRTGNGMVQVQMFYDESSSTNTTLYRDHLQGKLYKPLIANKSYCVRFYVTLEQTSQYAINHIGAYFDNGLIDTTVHTCGLPQTQYTPQIVENTIINDTLNWIKIEGSFIATGTEKFITIGNFFSKANTSYISVVPLGNGQFTWYLVDDVSVIETGTPAHAGNDTTITKGDSIYIGEIAVPNMWYKNGVLLDSTSGGIWVKPDSTTTYVVKQTLCGVVTWDSIKISVVPVMVGSIQNRINDLKIFPNPNNGNFTISGSSPNSKEATIKIYNVLGQTIYQQTVEIKNNKLNQQVTVDVPPGIYVLRIHTENENYTVQVIKNQ